MFALNFKASQRSLGREQSPAVLFSYGTGEALKVSSRNKLIKLMAWAEELKPKLQS